MTLLKIRSATKLRDSSASIAYVDALATGLALQLALQELSNVLSQSSASWGIGKVGVTLGLREPDRPVSIVTGRSSVTSGTD
jgi:hypothetical protein